MSRGQARACLNQWLAAGVCCLLMACAAPGAPSVEPTVAEETTAEEASPVASKEVTGSMVAGAPTPTVSGEVRPAAFAGDWYSDDPDELAASVDAMLDFVTPVDGQPIGLLVPHAGHVFSGPVAAHGFKQVEGVDYNVVVIIGPNHRHPTFGDVSVWAEGGFETPLGVVRIDEEIAGELIEADERIVFDREVHLMEHSVEIELPFLQRACPDCTFVPVVMGRPSEENIEALGKALVKSLEGRKALIVASTDLSHYPGYEDAARVDIATLAAIETGDTEWVKERIEELMAIGVPNLHTCACGEGPMFAMMHAAKELGADTVTILGYANSGDTPFGGQDQVVGYGAVMFWDWDPPELSQADKEMLLAVARGAIAGELGRDDAVSLAQGEPVLERRSAVFVTLLRGEMMRGCIGQLKAQYPLAEAVWLAAVDAATEDPRFPPLAPDELDEVSIEISVLSPFRRVTDVEDIHVGTHGLVIVSGDAQGLLLPQVATEEGYDREELLEAVSQKAGLPPDAWHDAALYTFTAEVFGEAN